MIQWLYQVIVSSMACGLGVGMHGWCIVGGCCLVFYCLWPFIRFRYRRLHFQRVWVGRKHLRKECDYVRYTVECLVEKVIGKVTQVE